MLYFAIAALVVIIDQASKRIIWEIYKSSGGTDVIDGFFRVTLSKNTGAVMGILAGSRTLLIIVTIFSIILLILFAYRMRYAPVSKRIYIGLIFGGAFGNMIDRIATGEVLDFLDIGIGSLRWPTFNVADVAVTVGAVLLIYGFVRHPHGQDVPDQEGAGALGASAGRGDGVVRTREAQLGREDDSGGTHNGRGDVSGGTRTGAAE